MKLSKVTTEGPTSRRRYDDACAATYAMNILGERWALPVMRELMLGPRRFGELKSSINGISANVLTQRLEGLEAASVVKRVKLPPPASVQVYELTEWGYLARPIFQAMGLWAVRSPMHDPSRPFSAVSLMLSMRTMIAIERVEGLRAKIGFRIGEESFSLSINGGKVDLSRGDIGQAELIFQGETSAIGSAIYAGVPIEELESRGVLEVTGDRVLAAHFVTLFPLPPKVSGA